MLICKYARLSWLELISLVAWHTWGELGGTTPPSGRTGWKIQKDYSLMVQKTKVEQSTLKKKDIKKCKENWIFTLYNSTKITKKTKKNCWMLCWFFTLRYSTTVSRQNNAHGFFIQMNIWNSTRGWSLVWMQLWHLMSLLCWPHSRPSIEEVQLVSKCGDRKNSVRRKHKKKQQKVLKPKKGKQW